MQKPAFAVLAAFFVLCFCSTRAAADYRGPGAAPGGLTVAQILDDPKDDTTVVLQGVIVRKVAPERYIFSDGTGEVQIEIDDEKDVFPAQPVDETTRVEIAGEIDKDFRKPPQIDVDAMKIIDR